MGRGCALDEDGSDHEVGVEDGFLQGTSRGEEGSERGAIALRQSFEGPEVPVENGHVRTQSERHLDRIRTDDAPAQHGDPGGCDARYAAEQKAKARRITAEAEAYATSAVARAIADNGLEAAQYQVALKQVEALTAVGQGEGKQVVVVPASALDAFGEAFRMLKGKS